MPKETIQVGKTESDPAEVNVGWSEGYVQLATLAIPNGGEAQEGMWVDLSRTQINQLIQNLRKARDRAYGKDE